MTFDDWWLKNVPFAEETDVTARLTKCVARMAWNTCREEDVRRIRAYREASACSSCNEFLLDLEKSLEEHKP